MSRPRSHFPTRGWTRPRSARTGTRTAAEPRPGRLTREPGPGGHGPGRGPRSRCAQAYGHVSHRHRWRFITAGKRNDLRRIGPGVAQVTRENIRATTRLRPGRASMATETATTTTTGLRRNAIGLREVTFQSITDMAPGAAIAASIPAGVAFAGGSLPLAVVFALIACLFCAWSI